MNHHHYVGAVDEAGEMYCLRCLSGLPVPMKEDIEEAEAHKEDMHCNCCGGNLVKIAEEVNDPQNDMSYIEQADDEIGELYS